MVVLSFSLYFFYFISLLFPFLQECFFFSLFLFLFTFLSFSLYIFLSLFCSLSLFNLGGSFGLVQVKQAVGFYRVFIIKNKGRGRLYSGECN